MSEIRKNLGGVTAYAYARSKGYTGTEEEFAQLMANYATVGETATEAAEQATTKAGEASTSATNAATSASAASASATAAAGSASAAATSETNAAASASSASTSAGSASESAGDAAESAAAAQAVKDSIPADYTALSGEVTDLKNAIDTAEAEIESIISVERPISLIPNHNIYTGSAVGQIASLQINENENYSYILLNCSSGDKYKVKVTGGSTPSAWAFVNSENIILAVSAYGAVDETIVAPDGAVKLAINDNSGTGTVVQITADGRLDNVENKTAKLSGLIDETEDISLGSAVGKNIYTYGNIGDTISLTPVNSTNPDWRYVIYDCNGGDEFFVSVTGASSPRAWAFVDTNNKLLGNCDAGAFSGYIIAPTGAKKLIINDNSLQGIAYYFESTGRVSALERQWNAKRWACVGDSLTEVNAKASKRYFDYVSERTGISIINMGVGGSGYAKRNGESLAFYQRILNIPSNTDVITIFGSFNDYSAGLPLGSWNDTGTSTLAGCINTTLENLYSVIPTAKVGIVTPTPWYAGQYSLFYPFEDTSETGAFANAYVDLLVEICRKKSIPCLDLFHCSNLRPWDAAFRTLAYSNDDGYGTHPDNTGHEIIASKFKWLLDELIVGL